MIVLSELLSLNKICKVQGEREARAQGKIKDICTACGAPLVAPQAARPWGLHLVIRCSSRRARSASARWVWICRSFRFFAHRVRYPRLLNLPSHLPNKLGATCNIETMRVASLLLFQGERFARAHVGFAFCAHHVYIPGYTPFPVACLINSLLHAILTP